MATSTARRFFCLKESAHECSSPNTPRTSSAAQAALAALTRAGLRTAEHAKRSHTRMVAAEKGEVLHVTPREFSCGHDEQSSPASSQEDA